MTFKGVEKPEKPYLEQMALDLDIDIRDAFQNVGNWFHSHRHRKWNEMFASLRLELPNLVKNSDHHSFYMMVLAVYINEFILKNGGS